MGPPGVKGEKGDTGAAPSLGEKELGDTLCQRGPRSCKDLLTRGIFLTGWYTIHLPDCRPLTVLCDMDVDGGGWTVFQRRVDGSIDFFRDWDSYKRGFGNLGTEFWLGNDYLHLLTANGNQELRVDLQDFQGKGSYAKYSSFQVSEEQEKYKLTLGQFLEGTAGDSLTKHNNMSFTTHDQDNDANSMNCAALFHGAWWYHNCHQSNLNGRYLSGSHESYADGINWGTGQGHQRISNMAAPQDVHVRICNQEIVKFDLEVKALIQDIRDCSGPLSELTELNTKVKEKFQQLKQRIQELEQSAREQDKESEKQLLLQEVENHKKQMLSNQTSWRKANLTCKLAIDNLEKAELLQGGDSLRQRKTTKESLAQTSSSITESLMGISRMMSQQVQQSEEAMQTLVSSSRTLLDANEEFKSMSGTIQLGRKLITKYNRRELTDKLLIFLALALFLATVLYIVKKRLFPFL